MKEYQLQEGQLLASFRPHEQQQPPPYPPQGLQSPYPPPPYQHLQAPHHSRAPSQTSPYQHHLQPQPIHTQHQQQQSRHQRTASPPVVFNYRENSPAQGTFYQRQSIVQTVGVPIRHAQGPQIQGQHRQQQRVIQQVTQGTPASTPQQQPSRGPSQPSAGVYYEQQRGSYQAGTQIPYAPAPSQAYQQYPHHPPQMQHIQNNPKEVPVAYTQQNVQNYQNYTQKQNYASPHPQPTNVPIQQQQRIAQQHIPPHLQVPPQPHHPPQPAQKQVQYQTQPPVPQQEQQEQSQHPQQGHYHHPQYGYQGPPQQQYPQQYGYQQEGQGEGGQRMGHNANELDPEEQQILWIQQQQQMQYQGNYPQGEGEYQYPLQYYGQITPQYLQAIQGQANLWKDRFFYLYDKFEVFCEKHEGLNKEGIFLGEQFLTLETEDQWVALKEKYDSLVERMTEVKEENMLIIQEIQQNLQHNQKMANGAIKEEASRVWEIRYHDLLEQYESLSQHYADLQSSSMAHNDLDDNNRVAMMNEKYNRLQAEYNHVVQELQKCQSLLQMKAQHQELLKYTQQLQGYIEQLQSENNTLMRGMKTSVEESKMLTQQEINQKIMEKDNQIKNLTNLIVNLEEKVKQGEANRPKSNISNGRTSQLQSQIQEMSLYCNQIEQKLSMKDYEINGLKDKIQFLEQELHHKKEELFNQTNILHQKLAKIETDIATKASQPAPLPPQSSAFSSFSLEQDYQARLREYQRSIQAKNNDIRLLEERISESENQTRKVSLEKSALLRQWQQKVDALQQENRRKIQDKDSKIKTLEYEIKEKEAEVQKKVLDKDNAVRSLQAEISNLKDQIDTRLVEKDATIRSLRDANQRLNADLKDKITEVSRIKSPHISPNMRSPNQSFIAETFRHEEEHRLLTQQLERRSDEIGKLKKERDARNKQYKDLEAEYETLQEENNKRRLQINNLKRQSSAIDNLQLQIESLRGTISKKNQEIGELKNALFELDRLKMQLESARREVEKQNEISRIKNRDIQQLTDRNYELEQKIRQKQFKPHKLEQLATKNVSEELMNIQDDNRKKQMEITRLKVENEEINRTLRRTTDELQEVKLKYPSKLKLTEEELVDAKLKLSNLEKKCLLNDNRAKELEEALKRVKAMAIEQQNSETNKVQEHFNRLVERLEEDNKQLKQKIRAYEIKVNELEIDNDSLTSNIKELQVFKDQNAKRIISLNDRLEEKESQIKRIRDKESNEVLKFRKKESRTIQLEAALKSREEQAREAEKQRESLRLQLKNLKKEFDDYKHHVIEQMQFSTNKEMENINKQLNQYEAKFALQNHNFDFKLKDKAANHVFQRTVIYQLKEENDFLRRELEGRGSSISLEKMRITQLQQEALLKSKNISNAHPSAQEEIEFYRQKNRELEERVNSNIAMNKSLKDRIEQLIQSNSKIEEAERQRLRILDLQHTIEQLNGRLQRLQEENKHLRNELANSAIAEAETYQIQDRVQELQRLIDQLTRQKHSLLEQIKITQTQKQKLEASCHEFEKSLTRSENKINILQSEIERLKETTRAQKPSSADKQMKGQIEELTMRLRQKDERMQQETSKAAHFEEEFVRAEQQVRSLQQIIEKLHRQRSNEAKDDSQLERWREAVESLQGSVQKMSIKINQLEGEAEYYKSQAQRGGVPEDIFYFLEIIRSNYLQLEALCAEISIQNQQAASVGERMIENCRRGLESCQYLNELLSG